MVLLRLFTANVAAKTTLDAPNARSLSFARS